MPRRAPIRYRVVPSHPEAHLLEVSCTVADPDPQGQLFSLPTWIPGSYLIREFARHVVTIRAASLGRPVALEKIDKNTWRAAAGSGPLTVTAEIYAWDASVRGACVDTGRAFFNGPSVFLRVAGQEDHACEVEILRPRGARYRNWQVATAMRRLDARPYGFGVYRAADYDELIDHPVEMGSFMRATFRAGGVPHDIVITGRHDADMERLCRDLRKLCEQHIALFGELPPMERYVFLVTALGEGYGGLEHRASTALLCSRDDLPQPGVEEVTDAYRTFLGLCSHEYFHTWNVKRIKPAAFVPYDLDRESYTRLLWAFEGITSYYDDLALVRSGLISHQDYLELLGRTVTTVQRGAGRGKQSVAESSFDAWIKYYRQDENSPNAVVSYYAKGSLVALCLDLLIRHRSRGRRSLDDVVKELWLRHGRTGIGVEEDGVERIAQQVTGLRLRPFFDRALRSTRELPLKELLATVGVQIHLRPAESLADRGGRPAAKPVRALARSVALGARTADDAAGVRLTHVLDGGPAQACGLAAGDVIVALGGLRVGAKNLENRLARYAPGARVPFHAFRRDELRSGTIVMQRAPLDTCVLTSATDAASRARLDRWLAGR